MAKKRKKNSGQEGAGFYDDDGNWVDLEWGNGKKKGKLDAARARMIGIGAGLAILIAGTAYFIVADNAKPRVRKKEKAKEEVVTGGMRHFKMAEDAPDTTRVSTIWDFSEDILKLDRKVYKGVRFTLEFGKSISSLAESQIDLAKVVIKIIEIDVRSKPWDALKSDDRIQFLFKTYRLLKGNYPEITRRVRLVFDDQRQNLDFEFDKMFS